MVERSLRESRYQILVEAVSASVDARGADRFFIPSRAALDTRRLMAMNGSSYPALSILYNVGRLSSVGIT